MQAVTDLELVVDSDNSFIEELTVDGWFSLTTGQGLSKDKSESVDFLHRPRFVREEIVRGLWRGDSIAARIVSLIVDDSMRQGWTVEFFTTGEDGNREKLDPAEAAAINAKRIEWEKKVGLKENVSLWWQRGRAFGGALLVFGADDGSTDKMEPLNLERIKSFDWLRPLTRHEVSVGPITTDPRAAEEFGKPASYSLHSRVVGSDELAQGVMINSTRGARYEGVRVDELASMLDNLDGWGDSIFERVWVPLRNWNSAVNAAGTIIQDFSQSIYSIDGLRQVLRAKGQALIAKQFQMQEQFRSLWNATVIDTKDKYERKTTSVAGMPDLIDRFGLHLSAASGMPLTLLLGLSPGGFGTGEAEENNWVNIVQSEQQNTLVPLLERIYKVLFATPEFKGKVPDAWQVVPVPLKQKTESDQAEIQNKQADTDTKYIAAGVLDAEEVAQSRFGKGEYSLHTTLDQDTRKDFAESDDADPKELDEDKPDVDAAGDAEKPADAAMNGAQVTGLIDIVAKVATKELPRDSAVSILQVAYLLSPENAEAVVGSAGQGFDPTEEPEEVTPEVEPGAPVIPEEIEENKEKEEETEVEETEEIDESGEDEEESDEETE